MLAGSSCCDCGLTYPFLMNVDVAPLSVLEELLSTIDERDSGGPILAEINVEDSSAPEHSHQVLMSGSSRETGEVNGSSVVTWERLGAIVTLWALVSSTPMTSRPFVPRFLTGAVIIFVIIIIIWN